MAKAAFSKKTLFTSKLDLKCKEKTSEVLHWSIALYGAETWTLRKVGQKYLKMSETWCWRRKEKLSRSDCVKNE
jgi:hypothetical protein